MAITLKNNSLSNTSVNEGTTGAVVGSLSFTDTDPDPTHTLSFSVSDPRFQIVHSEKQNLLELKSGVALDNACSSGVNLFITMKDLLR